MPAAVNFNFLGACFCGPENGPAVLYFQHGVPVDGPGIGTIFLDCFVFLCVCFCAVWCCLCFPRFQVSGWGHSWVFFCCLQLLDFCNLVSLGFLGWVGFRSISHVLARSMGLRHDVTQMCLIESGVFNIIARGHVQVHG